MHAPKRLIHIGSIALLSTLVSFLAFYFGFFSTWQEKILDRFFTAKEVSGEVVIVSIDQESVGSLAQWPLPRAVYAQALGHLAMARVVGIDVNFFNPSSKGEEDDKILEDALARKNPKVVLSMQIDPQSGAVIKPIPQFAEQAVLGFNNVLVDADGLVRTVQTQKGELKSFASALSGAVQAPEEIRIAYHGAKGTFLTIPIIDVMEGRVPERILQDKIIVIGATAEDLHDFHNTPFGRLSGVEVHANSIETLAQRNFFTECGALLSALLMLLIGALVTLIVYRLRSFKVLVLTLLALLALIVLGAMLLFGVYIIIPIFYLLLVFLLTAASTILFQYVTESREKQFIRKSFQQYLAPEVVDALCRDASKLQLGGEEREVSILFSDIRDFTSISESLTPPQLMRELNEYLTAMTDIIFAKKGLVDKYIGDAIMAFWGAPKENHQHAYDSCKAAIAMLQAVTKLNERQHKDGFANLNIGIGISTGDVFVGNMGSKQRFNYSIIGDEVNLSSRLEGLNKMYHTACIISNTTKKAVEQYPDIHVRELDDVRVKGKKSARKIFELISYPRTDSIRKMHDHFQQGRAYYIKGEWEKAITVFKSALTYGNDGPSELFLERSILLKNDPPQEWDGVFDFKTK